MKKIVLTALGIKEELILDFSNKKLRNSLVNFFLICYEEDYYCFHSSTITNIFHKEGTPEYMSIDNKLFKEFIVKKIEKIQPDDSFTIDIDYTLLDLVKDLLFAALDEFNEYRNLGFEISAEGNMTLFEAILDIYNIKSTLIEGVISNLLDKDGGKNSYFKDQLKNVVLGIE